MKSLSLSRPLVLMMIGVPGSGKSFFARQFAATFNAPLVSCDHLRTTMFPDPIYTQNEDGLVQTLARQQAIELLKTQRTFIVDGGLNIRAERLELEKLAHTNGYGFLLIWVQTDEPSSRFRATHRKADRETDALNLSLTAEQFLALTKQFTAPSPQEPHVVISGKHTYATQAKVVLKKLVAPRSTSHSSAIASTSSHHEAASHRRSISIN